MALDKAIKHGKEHRKPYRGAKAFLAGCRNHGWCPWCRDNRTHKFRDKHMVERMKKDEYLDSVCADYDPSYRTDNYDNLADRNEQTEGEMRR